MSLNAVHQKILDDFVALYSSLITQVDIVDTASPEKGGLTLIENGNANPSVEVAKKIASVMGFDWTRFYEDEDDLD